MALFGRRKKRVPEPSSEPREGTAARLHGLLLALTPQEQPAGPEKTYENDLRRVDTAEQLPSELMMGYRDDNSFVRTSDGFEVAYTLEGERVLELQVEGDSLRWRQSWHGLAGGGGIVPAGNLALIGHGSPLFESWQDEITRQLQAIGNFGWARHKFETQASIGGKDGPFVQVAFPINGQRLDEIAGFYEALWEESQLSICPIAYALFVAMPVTHRWSAQAEPAAPREWAGRFWAAYSSELGLLQDFPGDPVADEGGGTAITIGREGFLLVATLLLRDLLPFARRLVEHDLVAASRFEDDSTERPGWERTTAPFRAMASAMGTALEEELTFTDEQGAIECTYPTATAMRIYLDAKQGGAFEGLKFERVHELTAQYSGTIAGLDARLRAHLDEFTARHVE
jgi:hypothetical protein